MHISFIFPAVSQRSRGEDRTNTTNHRRDDRGVVHPIMSATRTGIYRRAQIIHCRSYKAGYELSLPLSELHQLVVECPVNSANRELMAEEKELRYEWMVVVYDMLNALNPDSKVDTSGEGDNISRVSSGCISQVIEAMLDIKTELQNEEATSGGKQDSTVALTNLTVQQAMERSPQLSKLNESTTDPMQKALLTNDIRVALMTFRVLEEEKICMQDTAGGMKSSSVPRPPIPGT